MTELNQISPSQERALRFAVLRIEISKVHVNSVGYFPYPLAGLVQEKVFYRSR